MKCFTAQVQNEGSRQIDVAVLADSYAQAEQRLAAKYPGKLVYCINLLADTVANDHCVLITEVEKPCRRRAVVQ